MPRGCFGNSLPRTMRGRRGILAMRMDHGPIVTAERPEGAGFASRADRTANVLPELDEKLVHREPVAPRHDGHEGRLRLLRRLLGHEPQAVAHPVDVRVHG